MPEPLLSLHGRDAQESRKQRLQREALEDANNRADLIWLMSTEQGRRIVRRLITKCRALQSPFDQNAMQMARNDGLKAYAVWLLEEIEEHCTEGYLQMKRELRAERNDRINRNRADDRNTKQRSDGE